jgi:hypothetical protein
MLQPGGTGHLMLCVAIFRRMAGFLRNRHEGENQNRNQGQAISAHLQFPLSQTIAEAPTTPVLCSETSDWKFRKIRYAEVLSVEAQLILALGQKMQAV